MHHLHHQDTATESSMSSSTSKYISLFINLRILYQQNTKTKCSFEKKSFRPNFLGNSNVYLSAKSRVNQIPSLIKSPMEFTSCCVSCANKLKGTISQSPSTAPMRCSRVPKHLKERVEQLPPASSFYLPGLVPGRWWRSRTGAHVIVGESQNSGRSVVSEVHKHVVVGTAAKSKTGMFKEGRIFPPARWCVELFSVCVFFFTHLFSTFPEPPLTAEASPFSTARKFCGVTSCGGGGGTTPYQSEI